MTTPNLHSDCKELNPYLALPSVAAVIGQLGDVGIVPELLTDLVRGELETAREEIQAGNSLTASDVMDRCRSKVRELEWSRFDSVINGTGIILHTNLGRAPVSAAAAKAMADAAGSYLSLEIDPETNQRGGRMDEISRLLRLLTGAESTLVVNNNAAAILLTLATLSAGRDVIVSRGEAVEIGGGFRIPDVVLQSGCRLVDVGTTNRTYLRDYRRAVGQETSAFLKVHASNFRVHGFTEGVTTTALGVLSKELGIPLIEDLGSGALIDTARFGLLHEPTVGEAIFAGASVVTMSGDKLFGGPQAGIIAGQRELIAQIERHPLARAMRADKVTLAGVAATLRHYVRGDAERAIPIWTMIGASTEQLGTRAEAIADAVGGQVVSTIASIGGGSLPGETLPSLAVRLSAQQPDALAKALRTGRPRVFPIIRDDAVLIDLRSVRPEQDAQLTEAIASAVTRSA